MMPFTDGPGCGRHPAQWPRDALEAAARFNGCQYCASKIPAMGKASEFDNKARCNAWQCDGGNFER